MTDLTELYELKFRLQKDKSSLLDEVHRRVDSLNKSLKSVDSLLSEIEDRTMDQPLGVIMHGQIMDLDPLQVDALINGIIQYLISENREHVHSYFGYIENRWIQSEEDHNWTYAIELDFENDVRNRLDILHYLHTYKSTYMEGERVV